MPQTKKAKRLTALAARQREHAIIIDLTTGTPRTGAYAARFSRLDREALVKKAAKILAEIQNLQRNLGATA